MFRWVEAGMAGYVKSRSGRRGSLGLGTVSWLS
jgi:hypothetical protein